MLYDLVSVKVVWDAVVACFPTYLVKSCIEHLACHMHDIGKNTLFAILAFDLNNH
jgi:hypothetical protein